MKVKIFVVVVILIAIISGVVLLFLNNNKGSEKNNGNIVTEENTVEDILLKVINNEQEFITERGDTTYLKDFDMYGEKVTISRFAYVDFDQDGENEMVIETNSGSYSIVLHYENQRVYGYLLSARAIYDIKNDGTYTGNGGEEVTNIKRMRFATVEYEEIILASKVNGEYEVAGMPATEEQFNDFQSIQDFKEEVEWTTDFVTSK